jgi:hypothetical protein
MRRWVVVLLTLVFTGARAQEKGVAFYYAQALQAYKAKSYPRFYAMIREAYALHPYHQGILYQLGVAAALTGHTTEAIENLKKAILIDNTFQLAGVADFNSISKMPAFQALLNLQHDESQPVLHSDTAFVITDRALHTEGIEADPEHHTFYLGSIHKRKIIKRTADGTITDFCPSGQDGMTSIFGIKVDARNNVLWACSSPMPEMENYDSAARSAVFKFDLTTGRLLEKIQRPAGEQDGVFGDLILNKKGEAFISDSKTNIVYTVRENSHQLEPYFASPEFWNIQGLAFSDDESELFISDYVKGIYRLTTKSKVLTPVTCGLDISLKGVDGLTYYKNSLIAIQNGVTPTRATRYFLNSSRASITRFEIIDRKHPAFNEPTLGVVVANAFYYIANSQWEGYDASHRLKPLSDLQDIVILKSILK